MNSGKIILILLFGTLFIAQSILLIKNKKFVLGTFLTAAQGICTLLAVNLIGSVINVRIPLNFWSLGFSSLFGITGVIIMLVINVLFLTH